MTDGERLENIVEAAVARGDAPGVVAAVATGDETRIAVAGAMAVGGPPMRPDTLFRIASITKPVTAAVVLSLADEGVLALYRVAKTTDEKKSLLRMLSMMDSDAALKAIDATLENK